MIIDARGLIFVHIQKTGGNAISTALAQNPNCAEKHFLACELRELYGADKWNSYVKFAFVRNPWDRLVSWWSMIDGHRAAYTDGMPVNKLFRFVLERAATFEEFLENCDDEIVDADGRKWIYRNQLDYLTDASGRQMVDFIGRFETLQQDFDTIMQKVIGGPVPLPHVNKSQHNHYTDYFTPTLAEKVAHRFERDINAFGYVFGR